MKSFEVRCYLLLISLVFSAARAALQKYWRSSFSGAGWMLDALNSAFSFVVVSVLFASIYKWLPDPGSHGVTSR